MDKVISEDKLWFDKYHPKKFSELDYNDDVSNLLKTIAQNSDFPHMIFYGPEGAGKKTRIRAFLDAIYGNGVHKITTENRTIKVNSTSIEYMIVSSPYHIGIFKYQYNFIICYL